MKGNVLYFVIPCYNEEEVLPETSRQLLDKMLNLIASKKISSKSRIVFVDDGSTDRTWQIIEKLHSENEYFSGISLSINRGHQNALLAGLLTAKDYADVVISLDADLQDDINAVDEMIDKFNTGCDIVYGVRSSRSSDSFSKRITAELFYKVMSWLGAKTVFNHADYRLMSKRAIEALSKFKETNLFLRGLIPLIGFKTDLVYYERHERFAGESKYPLSKMLAFALQGITSFSVKPIRIISAVGAGVFFVSLAMLVYILIAFFKGNTVAGWASISVSIWAIGGLTLLAIGIVGEYIGKIYVESKNRPRFIIDQFINSEDNSHKYDVAEYIAETQQNNKDLISEMITK